VRNSIRTREPGGWLPKALQAASSRKLLLLPSVEATASDAILDVYSPDIIYCVKEAIGTWWITTVLALFCDYLISASRNSPPFDLEL